MLQLRPTFSESWYRVCNIKAKLRTSAQISRQYYRGERWYVVRDPAGNQFHRLSDAAYRFIGLLDGTRTVEQAWDLCGGQLADDAPTQPEVIQILSHLFSANLIDADITPDATVLLRRHKQLTKRKMQGRLMNVLFPRIPLWDLDSFLVRWLPLVKIGFSKFGAIVWLIVVGTAIAMVAPLWSDLKTAAAHSIDIHSNAINILYLWAVFVLIKLLHELGHAFACRRFGGECHELGIMFLVFVPAPYVDASTAWAFPSRWQRIFVGGGGMIVELFFASIAAFIWIATKDSGSLVAQLAYNAMLVASVSTVLFNANPLLRYDGYYILSDFLEIPNLRQKSTEYGLGLIKRHIFRVKLQQPLPPVPQRVWLLLYAVASSIYRVMVGFVIMLVVFYQIPVLGVLMALGGAVTWAVVPISKLFKYLALEPELHRKRAWASTFCVVVAACVIALIGFVPMHIYIEGVGVVEARQREVLHVKSPGVVVEINPKVKDGNPIAKDEVILVLEDRELETKIAELRANLRSLEIHWQAAHISDPATAQTDEMQISATKVQLEDAIQKKGELTVRAPFDGTLIAPNLVNFSGKYIKKGDEIGTVATNEDLVAKAVLDQTDGELLRQNPLAKTDIRLAGGLDDIIPGTRTELYGAATRNMPHQAVTSAAGADVPLDSSDPHALTARTEQVIARVSFSNPDIRYIPGQRAYVRFHMQKEPLIWLWGRRFWQLIQSRNETSKWI